MLILATILPVGSHVASQIFCRPEASQAKSTNNLAISIVGIFSLLVSMIFVIGWTIDAFFSFQLNLWDQNSEILSVSCLDVIQAWDSINKRTLTKMAFKWEIARHDWSSDSSCCWAWWVALSLDGWHLESSCEAEWSNYLWCFIGTWLTLTLMSRCSDRLLDWFWHFIDWQLQWYSRFNIAVLSQQMTIAIAFRCEQQWTLWTLEWLLAGVSQDVTTQWAWPWEFALTVWTRDAIRCQTIRRLLLFLANTWWIWIISPRIIAFRGTARCDQAFFVTVFSHWWFGSAGKN